MKFWIPFVFVLLGYTSLKAQTTVHFPSKDGLLITADLYQVGKDKPYMVLCHLAGLSRGEYKDTAKKLNQLGYNCLALDARSGNEVFGITNETAQRARDQHKPTEYLDAEQDILAAIDYTDSLSGDNGVILFGSSYSAALALKIGTDNPKVKRVIAFSPGEYFGEQLQLKEYIKDFHKPLFVTSAKKEAPQVTELTEHIKGVNQFIPQQEGAHGSIALWETTPGHEEYWQALQAFLMK